jgi:hypothetical protein
LVIFFFGSVIAKMAMATSYHCLLIFGFVAMKKAMAVVVVAFFF